MVSGIILAGGSSTRYGTGENKTLVELLGRPVLEYSLRVFLAADVVDEVVLAAKAGEEAALRKLAEGLCLQKPVTVVTGGADRAASVENALAAARGEVVLIQDGARPLVTERMLEDCLAALEEADGATIATPSRDTVKLADEEGYAEATTDRSRTWLIQTPQAFYREELLHDRKEDIQRGSTRSGPQRDELEILVNEVPARLYGSQGQQRSSVLALKMAECSMVEETTSEAPIVLLDDVMSELDAGRRDYLLNHLDNWQVFVTCCDDESFRELRNGRSFLIDAGQLQRTEDF